MKILVFLHGTLIMHATGMGKSREDRVRQSANREPAVLDYENYVPVGNAVEKLRQWEAHGNEIFYLSSHESQADINKDKAVLKKYDFPKGPIFWRENGKSYSQVAEEIMPDILIEDDCESIGGEKEMTYPNINQEIKKRIKSVVVKEFEGIDSLSDELI